MLLFYVKNVCSQSFVGAKVVILRKKTKTFLQKCILICVISKKGLILHRILRKIFGTSKKNRDKK